MAFVRKFIQGDRTYFALVEGKRDATGKVRQHVLKWYGTRPTPPPEPVTVTGVHFGVLAFKMMDGSLTPDDVFEELGRIGKKPVPLPELEAVGVRFDFLSKTLQVWLYPKPSNSKPRGRAPRAKAGGASKRRAAANDS